MTTQIVASTEPDQFDEDYTFDRPLVYLKPDEEARLVLLRARFEQRADAERSEFDV